MPMLLLFSGYSRVLESNYVLLIFNLILPVRPVKGCIEESVSSNNYLFGKMFKVFVEIYARKCYLSSNLWTR